MPSNNQQGDMYQQLMSISQEALVSGNYETAYHALCAAMHCASNFGNEQRLRLVEQVAKEQRDWIDTNAPKHRMSTQSAHQRQGISMYEMLSRQAAAHALMVKQEHRREHSECLPWSDDVRSQEGDPDNLHG